jgi:large subunit ribosomal protein L30e
MKDIRSDLGMVIKTGKVDLGENKVLSALLTGSPKLVLISGNCPNELKERVVYYSMLSATPCHTAEENSIEVGSVCGKPFPVSVLAVMDEGESNILGKFKKDERTGR